MLGVVNGLAPAGGITPTPAPLPTALNPTPPIPQGTINAASQQAAAIVPGTPQWWQRTRAAGTALSEATGSDKLGG